MSKRDTERALDRISTVIRAAKVHEERWGEQYAKDPKNHLKLIQWQARLTRHLIQYFADLDSRSDRFINWYQYSYAIAGIKAATPVFNIDVIINDDALGGEDDLLMKVMYDPIAANIALGILTGETIYTNPIGITQTDAIVQKATSERIAELVGKKVLKDGTIVDNDNAKYRISNKTREDIKRSITTSLNLGETTEQARSRLRDTIINKGRAATIANTELVNAYNKGVSIYGEETGATHHIWQDAGAVDICAENSRVGAVPINQAFPSGDYEPAAHPNCLCSVSLVYPEEARRMGLL